MDDSFLSGSLGQARGGSVALAALLSAPPSTMTPPSITGPAQYITDAGGSLWSFDANGTIYRNGRKVSTNNVVGVSKVIIVGSAVFAFTSGAKQWWQWSGTGFTGPITDGDPNILK